MRWLALLFLISCQSIAWAGMVFNDPYPENQQQQKNYYGSFNEQPKTLDPARSYSSNEYIFLAQIVEPPLQYDYLKRPYQLIPLMASQMPEVAWLDAQGKPLNRPDDPALAYTQYTISIQPGVYFQPHPAFALDKKGRPLYLNLPEDYLDEAGIHQLGDFQKQGSREVTAADFVYQIKRLANPKVSSSIYGLMSEYIVGFREFGRQLPKTGGFLDLRDAEISGVKVLDKYRFSIQIKGQYPQFLYWLAMPFFAPTPWEVDRFYAQEGMEEKNLSFDWYPIGTGPFMLTENNPNRQMTLVRNPNYRPVYFPTAGDAADKAAGFLQHAGQRLPLVDAVIFTLEKESIPRWNKYLQGYYDSSGITPDSFDQAIHINRAGQAVLTEEMQDKKMRLTQTADPTLFYLGFNMLDPLVGGYGERARKLRQAISIAVNYDENIVIFFNGRGQPAQGPLPPGIFGHEEGEKGINPYVYQWRNGKRQRLPISRARQLMQEAGFPGGIDPKTGKHLILNYDVPATGGPDEKALFDWMRKQFAKIGISLNVRATQYNQFQEKMRHGNAQLYSWGWNADYPDPENFFFLLYGPNGKVKHGGENSSNYDNPRFNRLFDQMKNRPNDARRLQLIQQMLAIVRRDAPWAWGINPQTFVLNQQWVSPVKPNTISLNTLKYVSVDVPLRNRMRQAWNQPVLWPLALLGLGLLGLLLPLVWAYRHKEKQPAARLQS